MGTGEMMKVVVTHPRAQVRTALEGSRRATGAPSPVRTVEAGPADPAALWAACRARRPDVVVVNERFPEDLLDAHRRGEEDALTPGCVLIVADTFSGEHITRCLAGGIGGYIWRYDDDVDLCQAIGDLGAGRRVFSRSVLSSIIEWASRGLTDCPAKELRHRVLPPREHEVLDLLSEGLSNLEIATRLWISEAGVKSHVSRAMRRFGVKNRVQLARLVWEADRLVDSDRFVDQYRAVAGEREERR